MAFSFHLCLCLSGSISLSFSVSVHECVCLPLLLCLPSHSPGSFFSAMIIFFLYLFLSILMFHVEYTRSCLLSTPLYTPYKELESTSLHSKPINIKPFSFLCLLSIWKVFSLSSSLTNILGSVLTYNTMRIREEKVWF